ncbi:TPA: hypothetical protein QID76_004683 [Klebsiella aerogenes]|nr:hypothetical protein [Klebsiella aerogenes]
MTKSTITRERLGCIASWRAKYSSGHNVVLPAEEAEELAQIALAAMDSEPVAWLAIYHGEVYDEAISITRSVVEAQADRFGWESALTEIIPLYRHPQPAPVVQDGYVMVPIEPTMSQELAGYKTLNDTGRMSRLMKTRLSNIYRAMLAAAPQEVK